ncbi:hypothetical protein [Autumnicola musiva]|uniref:CopG family transcriptional regulator n=1 Tax=Autumnicola musiva TaxID=3075589 RepID=A0ABU3D471_9FLAO|nr:hypothetical protein [Zunongwangia sp. F117]MDT0676306.1 hypothetical protein [Zunongwangia sp. F117]
MKKNSIEIDENIYSETEELLDGLQKSRNQYFIEAIQFYNKIQNRKLLEKKLQKESYLVREDSMNVLKDFEEIDYAD